MFHPYSGKHLLYYNWAFEIISVSIAGEVKNDRHYKEII